MRLTTPRIMPAADNGLTEEQREIVAPMQARGNVLNIFRTLLNHPAAAKAVAGLDSMSSFLKAYRQIYPVDPGIVPDTATAKKAA